MYSDKYGTVKYFRCNKRKNLIIEQFHIVPNNYQICISTSFPLYFLPWNKNFQSTYWLLTDILFPGNWLYVFTIFALSLPSVIFTRNICIKIRFHLSWRFVFTFLFWEYNDFYSCEVPNRGLFLQVGNDTRNICDKISLQMFILIFQERIVVWSREGDVYHIL